MDGGECGISVGPCRIYVKQFKRVVNDIEFAMSTKPAKSQSQETSRPLELNVHDQV